ncbi:MAG TPA: DUF6438 domain-containing protein [Abditibacteriaceae bacterium]|jgi:hypothetical protein
MKTLMLALMTGASWSVLSCAVPQVLHPARAATGATFTRITLSHTVNGWGSGEAFNLTLRADGTATWARHERTVKGSVATTTLKGRFPVARFNKFAAMLRQANFFTLKPRYSSSSTDQATTTLGATSGTKTWSVASYGDAAPPEFFQVARAVSEERLAIHWTRAKSKPKTKSTAKAPGMKTAGTHEKPLTIEEVRIKAGAAAMCEVHHVALRQGTAPIRYGLPPAPVPGLPEARRTQFPRANTQVAGGYMIGDDLPRTASVTFCPQCRAMESQWLQTRHRNPKRD